MFTIHIEDSPRCLRGTANDDCEVMVIEILTMREEECYYIQDTNASIYVIRNQNR